MKVTGIVRRFDDLGRVVIPKEIRRERGIGEHTPMEIFVDGDDIILRKYAESCALCGSVGDLLNVNESLVCRTCAERAAKVLKGVRA